MRIHRDSFAKIPPSLEEKWIVILEVSSACFYIALRPSL